MEHAALTALAADGSGIRFDGGIEVRVEVDSGESSKPARIDASMGSLAVEGMDIARAGYNTDAMAAGVDMASAAACRTVGGAFARLRDCSAVPVAFESGEILDSVDRSKPHVIGLENCFADFGSVVPARGLALVLPPQVAWHTGIGLTVVHA